jgi:hypothetical protein
MKLINHLNKFILPLILLLTVSCNKPLYQVEIMAENDPISEPVRLTSYEQFQITITSPGNKIIIVTDMLCACTTMFLPFLNEYINEFNVLIHTIEYTHLLFKTELYGISLGEGETPIIAIYEQTELIHTKAYRVAASTHNLTFTTKDGFYSYMEERIIIIS